MLLWQPCCQVDEKVDEYSKYLFEPVDTNWSMVYEDGDMKVRICKAVVAYCKVFSFYIYCTITLLW